MKPIINQHALIQKCELKHDPIIVIVNSFTEDSANKFREEMSDAWSSGQPIVPVVIDSYGGQVDALVAMTDIVLSSRVPVATFVSGKAMSCGAFLAAFGSKGHRYVAPNARFMLHEVSAGTWGKIEEIKVDAAETERLNQWAFKMLDERCGKSAGYFLGKIHERNHADWFLTPAEALHHGFVDIVGSPTLRVNIDVKFNFG